MSAPAPALERSIALPPVRRGLARSADAISAVGSILLAGAAVTVLPLLWLPLAPAEAVHAGAFVVPALVEALAGVLLILPARRWRRNALTVRQGAVAVVAGWAAVIVGSAWPIERLTGLGWTPSLFESMSGWTTTGLSVVDVLAAPRLLLLWRSVMQLAGGAGLAIIMIAAVGSSGGVGLYRAEGRSSQLVPSVARSARLVLGIYGVYAVGGTAAYACAGMSLFEAVNHAFAAVSTGGFSTEPQSIGRWDSPVIEAITLALMVLGNLNFLTAWLLVQRRFRSVLANGEIKVLGLLMPAGAFLLFLLGTRVTYPALDKAARTAIFESVSALTTTGFSTVGYTDWPRGAWLVLVGLMIVGGGTCSTAGGVKQMRVYQLARTVIWEVRRITLPRAAVLAYRSWDGDGAVHLSEGQLRQTGTFFFVYISSLAAGTLVLAAHGIPTDQALFEFASALGTVGLSVGVTSPLLPPAVLWTQIAGMFLGRLEFFVVFAALSEGLRCLSRLAASALGRRAA